MMPIGREDVSDLKTASKGPAPTKSEMSLMRIAVAGTGGLARIIAYYIQEETSHHAVFLSRTGRRHLQHNDRSNSMGSSEDVAHEQDDHAPQPALTQQDYQVLVVDYSNAETLQYALRGIDTVISTVTGPNQVELIKAAVNARVRRFAPAEFEGLPQLRPQNDVLDRGRSAARQWLQYFSRNIQSTSFICGILYERFQPGGLAQSQIGYTSGFSREGDYILNCRTMSAEVPALNAQNQASVICMTAARDVGRFVTKALDMRQWPPELRMCGQRLTVRDLVMLCQQLRGQLFQPMAWHNPASLSAELQVAIENGDIARRARVSALLATAEGRYDFTSANLNGLFPDIRPLAFRDWFIARWNTPVTA